MAGGAISEFPSPGDRRGGVRGKRIEGAHLLDSCGPQNLPGGLTVTDSSTQMSAMPKLTQAPISGGSLVAMATHFLQMGSTYVMMASTCLMMARSQQLLLQHEGQRCQQRYALMASRKEILGGWGNLPAHLFDRMKELLDQRSLDSSLCLLKSARLVNRHWCQWATDATTFVTPTRSAPLEESMSAIAARFQNVQGMRLACHLRATDTGLQSLIKIPHLKRLDLRGCTSITDAGIKSLQSLKQLTHLSLRHCTQVTNHGVSHLGRLTGLTNLDLSWCNKVTLAGVRCLAPLTGLTYLNLRGCSVVSRGGIGRAYQRCLSYLKTLTCQIEF